ncbi:NUDIX hydrolase [Cecembia rubra]|uniref:ADP-ribose pyrophosphatase YjhB (NUDIX family) n=1 Tax=Cecembia rubra TaxID=1485585 RepID=A0A2P8EER3_9BACT|nr:NUDIX hydrolase [Cecembia rubra]PSL07958.1 ADP-ribose pyrophosphatase YjhB (NUDIX family) [Cecembia rubra]
MNDLIVPACFYRVSVKALILDDQKRFLLLKEENGFWELPGGGLDFGESPQQGITRELMEEMGLKVSYISEHPLYFFPTINPKNQYIVNAVYETKVHHLDFTPSPECLEIRFYTPEEVLQIKESMYPNVLEFIKHFNY